MEENNQELYNKHLERLNAAVTLGKPDRVPVILAADSFFARHMGVTLAYYLEDLQRSVEISIKSIKQLGEIDGSGYVFPSVYALGFATLAKVRMPGRELPPDAQWQIDEIAPMKVEDYDTIIEKGSFSDWAQEIFETTLQQAVIDVQKLKNADWNKAKATFMDAGIVPFMSVQCGTAYDRLSAARGMANLTKDLYRIPDKVLAVLGIMTKELSDSVTAQIKQSKPISVFVGGTRCAPEYMSTKMFEKFAFPYMKKQVEAVVNAGAYALLHFDNNWTRGLEYFKEFPKGKCILATDGNTDLYKAKEILSDHMCLMGDIPAAMLTLDTADQVYNYSSKLVKDLGPSGFILAVGCCTPLNAKPENVKAMISAATGK